MTIYQFGDRMVPESKIPPKKADMNRVPDDDDIPLEVKKFTGRFIVPDPVMSEDDKDPGEPLGGLEEPIKELKEEPLMEQDTQDTITSTEVKEEQRETQEKPKEEQLKTQEKPVEVKKINKIVVDDPMVSGSLEFDEIEL